MKLNFMAMVFLFLYAKNAAAANCERQQMNVSTLRSELIMVAYVDNEPGRNRKNDVEQAAFLGAPLGLSLLASREELPIEKRMEYLQVAAATEYLPANNQLVELVMQISKPVSAIEYQFQIVRNALKNNDLYLSEMQKLALASAQKHHLIAAIFWSTVLSDTSNNSMGALEERANARLLEGKLSIPQLKELRARALLFRCERNLRKK